MKFSMFYLTSFHEETHKDAANMYQQIYEQVELAESIGFQKVWMPEHHLTDYGGDVPAPLLMLGALAQRTSRIKLGTGGVALPLHRPLELAEQLAMVDVMSNGRLEIGMVRAFLDYEYAAYNVDMGESRERFNEGHQIIRGLFEHERFSYDGKFTRFDDVQLRPRPIQRKPRMVLGTIMTEESFRYAGHNGLDLMVVPYLLPFDFVKGMLDVYRSALVEAGYTVEDFNIMSHFFYYGHADAALAKERPRRSLMNYLRSVRDAVSGDRWSKDYKGYEGIVKKVDALMDYEMMFKERSLYGHPEIFHRRVEEIAAAGITEIGLMPSMPGMPHDKVMETLEFFGNELLPEYQALDPLGATA